MPNDKPLLELRNIWKFFGEVVALADVNFKLYPHELVGLVGGNGAGKSTLIKIVAGVFPPDRGEMYLDGKKVFLKSPREAQEMGIYAVHQKMEEMLAPHHDVVANVFLGSELCKPLFGRWLPWPQILDKKEMKRQAESLIARTKVRLESVERPIISYSGGQRQAAAIARVLRHKPTILIFDEPTAALGVKEKFQVLEVIRSLAKDEGIATIIISHNLEEIFPIVDRIVVLRNGRVVGECCPAGVTKEDVVQLIVGGPTQTGGEARKP